MATNRIENLIDEIYEFVDSCKASAFAPNKVTVNKEELYELLDELKSRTPDEIKRYQKIIANRDSIIADAEDKAAKIIEEAKAKAKQLVGEHEIMQQAYARVNEMVAAAGQDANEMVAKAQAESEQLTNGALEYVNNMMSDMENILLNAYEATRERSEVLISSLKESYDQVAANRMEIYGQLHPEYVLGDETVSEEEPVNYPQEEQYSEDEYYEDENLDEAPEEDEDEGDYDFDEDTFFQDVED
jgi:vacuolar-type H+-ATPase subunit H